MQFIRASCFYLAIAALAIVYSPFCVVFGLTMPRVGYAIARHWCVCALACLRFFCGIEYHVTGNAGQHKAVYVCNHQSAWETIALMAILPDICFVLKRELLWIPFWGWGLYATNPIAINRSAKIKSLRQLLTQTKEKLEQGHSVVIFPEGTRCPPGQCGRMHNAYAVVASSLGCPVIPVAHNSGWFWPRRSFTKKEGCIEVRFGQPIETEGKKTSEVAALTSAWLQNQVASLPIPPEMTKL